MNKFFTTWLPISILILIPLTLLIMQAKGYGIYIINGDEYPWIINTEHKILKDSLSTNSAELLLSLKKDGMILSPQEYSSHTFTFFSWLLTILVAIIGVIVVVFGLNIDKTIETTLNAHLKNKWLELMRVDKEVDSTIGGIIDEKIEEATSELRDRVQYAEDKLKKIKSESIKFKIKK